MPIPSNGQNFVRPQSGGSGGWIAKLFGGIGDVARAKDMAQIQFDLHQAKAGVDTEHQGTRIKQKVAAETAGKVFVGDANAKRAIKTFKKFTDPKEEYIDKAGRKRTRGGFGLQVESPLANFDSNMLPAFQKTGLTKRKKSEGEAPVDSNASDGGNPPSGGAGKAPRKSRTKNTAGSQPRGNKGGSATFKTDSAGETVARKSRADANKAKMDSDPQSKGPDMNAGPIVTQPRTRKPRAPKAGA
jgi:hypothetical protein